MNTKVKDNSMHNTLVYVKQHWQLYVFFLGPALLLTIVFRYIPMGGILIAFKKYNPIKGIWASKWVGFKYFERFLRSQNFIVTNDLPRDIYGYYSQSGDIFLDADAINGIRGYSSQFLFGHELGYKIQRYRDVEPCYDIIRRVYDTSEETFQRAVLSDIFGSIVSGKKEIDDYPMEEAVQNQLKLEALKSVYRV